MNNYNISNTGVNIECNIGYDEITSQINFNDNIIESQYGFIYTNFGNIESYLKYDPKNIDLDDLYSFNESRINQVLFYKHLINELGYLYSDIKDLEIKDLCYEHLQFSDLDDLDNLISSSDVIYDKLYDIINITGYSQGDYASIIILTKVLKEVWGSRDIDLDDLKIEITHYFYDSPMIVRCVINNTEYISDMFDSQYEEYNILDYDKLLVINEILNHFKHLDQDILKNELNNIIPKELSYGAF